MKQWQVLRTIFPEVITENFEFVNYEESAERLDYWLEERGDMSREDYKKGTVREYGFTEERGAVLSIITAPEDMRKPCLEHIMNAATYGDEAACEIFRRVGANLAQLTKEMEYLLDTGTDRRFLFGRFVKNESCFRLIREGFAEVMPEVSLIAADEGLARSGLMRQLAAREDVTVAQFAQAVSAIYYSRM